MFQFIILIYYTLLKEYSSGAVLVTLFCLRFYRNTIIISLDRGSTVVKVLCYKSEGRWFDPSWCHWNTSLT